MKESKKLIVKSPFVYGLYTYIKNSKIELKSIKDYEFALFLLKNREKLENPELLKESPGFKKINDTIVNEANDFDDEINELQKLSYEKLKKVATKEEVVAFHFAKNKEELISRIIKNREKIGKVDDEDEEEKVNDDPEVLSTKDITNLLIGENKDLEKDVSKLLKKVGNAEKIREFFAENQDEFFELEDPNLRFELLKEKLGREEEVK